MVVGGAVSVWNSLCSLQVVSHVGSKDTMLFLQVQNEVSDGAVTSLVHSLILLAQELQEVLLILEEGAQHLIRLGPLAFAGKVDVGHLQLLNDVGCLEPSSSNETACF